MLLQQPARYLVFGIVATIPLIFGAVHPIVTGVYVFIMLVGCGGWLLLNPAKGQSGSISFWSIVPIVLLIYLVLQSIPIPIELVELLSPARAERVSMVNKLAGTNQQLTTLSDNGVVGIYRAIFLLALLLYYSSLKRLLGSSQKMLHSLVLCMVAVGAIEALYGLIQFVNPHIGILWLSIKGARAAHGTIIYKNQYASLLNMIWPLSVAAGAFYFMRSRKSNRMKGKRNRVKDIVDELSASKCQAPLLFFTAGMMVLAILFSLSRGGILAMVLVALIWVAILPFPRTKKFIFLALFVFLIGGYGAMLGLDRIVSRFDTLDIAGAKRIDIYLTSLPMLWDHWFTGIGIGSYTLLSPVYLKGFPANILYNRVHNEYLELMIELGIPVATLLFAWLLAGMFRLKVGLVTAIRKSEENIEKTVLGSAAFCCLVGFLVHGVADFGWRLPVNLVYAVTLLAITVSILSSEHDTVKPSQNLNC